MTTVNAQFLSVITAQAKSEILQSIAAHYGISQDEAYQEVTGAEAEHILDYMVGSERSAASVLMQRCGLRLITLEETRVVLMDAFGENPKVSVPSIN